MNIYLKCPHCKSILSHVMAASGNTIGATRYSDGNVTGQFLPDGDESLRLCSVCKGYLRINELVGPSLIDRLFKSKKNSTRRLELKDYIKALDSEEMKDPDKEHRIRTQILREFNDRIRKVHGPIKVITKSEEEKNIWKDNLERLTKMYEEQTIIHDDEEGYEEYLDQIYLTRAEMLRELSRFDECIDILKRVNDKKYDKAKEKMLKACEENNPYVMVIYEDKTRDIPAVYRK